MKEKQAIQNPVAALLEQLGISMAALVRATSVSYTQWARAAHGYTAHLPMKVRRAMEDLGVQEPEARYQEWKAAQLRDLHASRRGQP